MVDTERRRTHDASSGPEREDNGSHRHGGAACGGALVWQRKARHRTDDTAAGACSIAELLASPHYPWASHRAHQHPQGYSSGERGAAPWDPTSSPPPSPPPPLQMPTQKHAPSPFSAVGAFLRASEETEGGGGSGVAELWWTERGPREMAAPSPGELGSGAGGRAGEGGKGFAAMSAMAGRRMSMRADASLASWPSNYHHPHHGQSQPQRQREHEHQHQLPPAADETNEASRLASENTASTSAAASAHNGSRAINTPGLVPRVLGWGDARDPLSPAPAMSASAMGGNIPHTFGHGSWLRSPQAPKHRPRHPLPGGGEYSELEEAGTGGSRSYNLATPAAWRPAPGEGDPALEPLALHEALHSREVRAMTHARARDPETRAAAVRVYGDGLRRGFSAAHGERGAEVMSPWGGAAATSGRMFLRAGAVEALAVSSVHESDDWEGGGNQGFGFIERRIFPPPQPPMTDAEAEAAARHPGRVRRVVRDDFDGKHGHGDYRPHTPETTTSTRLTESSLVISKHQYASRYMVGWEDCRPLRERLGNPTHPLKPNKQHT